MCKRAWTYTDIIIYLLCDICMTVFWMKYLKYIGGEEKIDL